MKNLGNITKEMTQGLEAFIRMVKGRASSVTVYLSKDILEIFAEEGLSSSFFYYNSEISNLNSLNYRIVGDKHLIIDEDIESNPGTKVENMPMLVSNFENLTNEIEILDKDNFNNDFTGWDIDINDFVSSNSDLKALEKFKNIKIERGKNPNIFVAPVDMLEIIKIFENSMIVVDRVGGKDIIAVIKEETSAMVKFPYLKNTRGDTKEFFIKKAESLDFEDIKNSEIMDIIKIAEFVHPKEFSRNVTIKNGIASTFSEYVEIRKNISQTKNNYGLDAEMMKLIKYGSTRDKPLFISKENNLNYILTNNSIVSKVSARVQLDTVGDNFNENDYPLMMKFKFSQNTINTLNIFKKVPSEHLIIEPSSSANNGIMFKSDTVSFPFVGQIDEPGIFSVKINALLNVLNLDLYKSHKGKVKTIEIRKVTKNTYVMVILSQNGTVLLPVSRKDIK